jgi:enoyl-CoA hydratase
MEHLVHYRQENAVASIVMDDGKANAVSLRMLEQLNRALDRADEDRAIVLLAGRPRVFSAGFDLPTLLGGGPEAIAMLRGGFELADRLLSFPRPVVVACSGHAVAMGVFLLLSGDYRIGAAGDYRLTANEVEIGLTMPLAAVEILRHRLAPAAFQRAVTLAETFSPDNAVEAGFFDRLVEAEHLLETSREFAAGLARLDMAAHAGSKRRAREQMLVALRAGIEADFPLTGFRV